MRTKIFLSNAGLIIFLFGLFVAGLYGAIALFMWDGILGAAAFMVLVGLFLIAAFNPSEGNKDIKPKGVKRTVRAADIMADDRQELMLRILNDNSIDKDEVFAKLRDLYPAGHVSKTGSNL